MTTIQAVIAENRGRFARMCELNTRAGRDVFPIPTRDQLATGIMQILGGVARLSDIRWPEALCLPALDVATEAEVLRLAPDTIMVCGREVAVEYRAPYYGTQYPPRVRIDFRGEYAKDWLQLPEGGVVLPDGREVTIIAPVEGCGWSEIEAPSSQFKAKVQSTLNQGLWDSWQKPSLDVPAADADFPALVEREYGRCAVTGVSLVAYGTLYYDYYYGWKTVWYRDRAESERKRAEGVAQCLETREQAARDALKKRVGELSDAHYNELSAELRERLYKTRYDYSGGATTAAELEALIAQAEAAVAVYEAKQAEEEAAIASGRAMRDFEAWHRRGGMTNNGDGWVVRPDGSLRGRDSSSARPHKSDGTHAWKFVLPNELALRWSCSHMGDIDGGSDFEVVKLPEGGCTPDQLVAVAAIEREIGASEGAFGLDPEVAKRKASILKLVQAQIRACPATKQSLAWDEESLKLLLGANGRGVASGREVTRLVRAGRGFTEQCDAREAQVVKTWVLGEGHAVDALVYDKYGDWNLSLRYRPASEEEERAAQDQVAPSGGGKPASSDALAALAAKFGR